MSRTNLLQEIRKMGFEESSGGVASRPPETGGGPAAQGMRVDLSALC